MPKSITASVGLLGKNFTADTLTVQNLLNNVPINLGGPNPLLDPDGKCGNKTCTAIQMFQLKHFGWSGADGRVDPGGITLTMLNAYSPDPIIPQPQPQPQPEALSDDYIIWLRFTKGKFFSHPYDPKEFVFTAIDMTNQRRASYGLKFNGKVGTAAPDSGSGGQIARIKLKKPTTVSGLAGQAVYQTVIKKGSGPAAERLESKLFVVLEGNMMLTAKLGCHLLKPGPDGESVSGATDPSATPMSIDGQFHYNLNGSFVKL
ncbi:hypothetical protein F183_A52440 [Bryobacterales bacterium F-183]|nr:hypothetical protein F183_A52440 [Bryobacterales bacterium F-183]